MVLDTPRKDCPYVFQKTPTLPSSSRQALRGNDGISRARAESHIAECANARFRPPFFFCTLPPTAAYGGMTFDDPMADSRRKHADSIKCTATLTDLICAGEPCLPSGSTVDPDRAAKTAVRHQRQLNLTLMADAVQARLPDQLRRAMMVAREKGASSTSTTIPVAEHGFFFDVKSDFHDDVHLRYCWPIDNLPSVCACGARFTVHHAQICKLAGFIHMRHDDTTDFLAKCMREVHNDVEVE